MEWKIFFHDKMQKYLQKFAGNVGIESIFISWDLVISVIFASVEILLISAAFLPADTKFHFMSLEGDLTKISKKMQYTRKNMILIYCS